MYRADYGLVQPSKPLKNPKTPKDRPQKRGRFEEEQVVEEEGEEQEDELDPDPTPRGIRLTAAPRLRRPDTSYEYDQALSGSADSSKRSSSPVKIMEDLQYAEIPTDYQTLDGTVAARCQGFLKHYRELQDLGDRRALIPLSLKVPPLLAWNTINSNVVFCHFVALRRVQST